MQGGYAAKSLIVANQRFIHIGKKVKIKKNYRIECYRTFAGLELHPNIIFEDGVIVGDHLTIFGGATVRIGKDSIFAGNVTLISENHGMDPESEIPYHAQPLSTGDIVIGEGCWLGQNVCVLPNVKIGNKCIIATSSVVTHDVPDYSLAAGIPAKIIKRYNFSTHHWEKCTE
jgi:lipopolysaccharide O-acetyltransferase